MAPKSLPTRTTEAFILPKNSTANVRVFRMSPSAHAAVTRCIASKNAAALLQGNANDISIASIPKGATVVWPRKTLRKKSFAAQVDIDDRVAVDTTASRSVSCSETGWMQKNISIQTEQSFASNQWPMDGDVNKLLLENIGTQTNESVFDRAFAGTYSTLSQTDICFDIGQDLQSYNNQAVTLCDAQNQTVSESLRLPTCSKVQDFASSTSNDFDLSDITNLYSSIETQTDTNCNLLSAQTQTRNSLDFQQQTSINAEIAFDYLNDIQTQTDFFLPPIAASSNEFVNNCTQTSEPDIFDKILELN